MSERADEANVEPVCWSSRLVRAPWVRYTEVAGSPILVDIREAEVQALTPTWAGIWAQLMGRPIAEVFQPDTTPLTPLEQRNIVEVLRRLKARHLVIDAGAPDEPGPDDVAPEPQSLPIVSIDFAGSCDTDELLIDRAAIERVVVHVREAPDGIELTAGDDERRRAVRSATVVTYSTLEDTGGAIGRFGAIVAAIGNREVLDIPGVVDLLAEMAERSVTRSALA